MKSQTTRESKPASTHAAAPREPLLGRITHETLQKRVYDDLRAAFLESRFMPGQTLTLRALAEMTGTSVQPVREALQRLCAEGAMEWLPNTAFRVPEVDPDRYRELWDVRRLLEGQATRLAAARIGPDELAELNRINREMRACMRRGDADATLRFNRDFHFAIYRSAGSTILVSLIEMIWMQVSPLFAAFTRDELGLTRTGLGERLAADAGDFFALQDAVVEGLANHDPEKANTALQKLLGLSANMFLDQKPAAAAVTAKVPRRRKPAVANRSPASR